MCAERSLIVLSAYFGRKQLRTDRNRPWRVVGTLIARPLPETADRAVFFFPKEIAMRRAAISPRSTDIFSLAVLGGTLALWAAVGAAQDDQFREIRDALTRAKDLYKQPLNGVRWEKVYVLKGSEHPLYQVRGTNERGNKVEMEVTNAGRIIEVEEHGIPKSEVPAVVMDALKQKMPLMQPSVIEAIYQAGQAQPVCYGFEGEGADGIKVEVYISADGKTFWN
jgi:hypothetical protein